ERPAHYDLPTNITPGATGDLDAGEPLTDDHRPAGRGTLIDGQGAEPFQGFEQREVPPALPGTMIGPYKLREVLGEGGMGIVYVAEQERPVHRKVALKVIKPGMDTREVIARFEAERQALALMDHPNIAKVLDAGTTCAAPPLTKGGPGGVGSNGH